MCRFLLFENSADTAFIDASMPPIPRPVTTRHTESVTGLVEVVAMNMPDAITIRHPSVVGRRPILSLTPPRMIEPSAIPISSIDSTTPSPAGLIPHSLAMPGDAKLMERMSKPSSAFNAIVIPITMICIGLIGDRPITSRGWALLLGGIMGEGYHGVSDTRHP